MMEMKEQTGSRKKLLVPVVVLMLCLVTLTGAAYAYSSTLTNTGNTVDAHYMSIDFNGKGESPAEDMIIPKAKLIQFTDNFSYTAGSDKMNQVGYELSSPVVVATYKLYIDSDDTSATAVNLIVSSTDLGSKVLYNAVKISDVYDITFKVNSLDAKTVLLSGDAAAVNTCATTTKTVLTVVITFTLKDGTADHGFITNAPVTAEDNDAAADYDTAFSAGGNNSFQLTFKAERTTP